MLLVARVIPTRLNPLEEIEIGKIPLGSSSKLQDYLYPRRLMNNERLREKMINTVLCAAIAYFIYQLADWLFGISLWIIFFPWTIFMSKKQSSDD